MKFVGSQLFGNLILLVTVLVAFAIGYRQISLNDVVELYATTSIKKVVNVDNGTTTNSVVIFVRNVGTRLVYLDKYVFNGTEYQTNGQIMPSQTNDGGYWIDLPNNGQIFHVSLDLFYHDLDDRNWKSQVVADFTNNSWKTSSLPRIEQ
jgi:hypothetical protein